MKKKTFKQNDVVLHKEENKMFTIVAVDKYNKDKLYTLKEVTTNNEAAHKRYYSAKISEKCTKVKNDKAVKVLFGKKG